MKRALALPLDTDDHVIGPIDAPVGLIEYGDYECPYCAQADIVVAEILAHFEKPLLYAFRHFPLADIHSHAEHAAEAAEFAGAGGKFWEMHRMLFEHQKALDDDALMTYADALGLDPRALAAALAEAAYAPRVKRDVESGLLSGVRGTPTFFINGALYEGPHTYHGLTFALSAAAEPEEDE